MLSKNSQIFVWDFSDVISIQACFSPEYAAVSVTFSQRTIIEFCHWYSVFPMTSFHFLPKLSKIKLGSYNVS